MSNYKQLREVILGCATRAQSSFAAGSTNLVDIAINNAVIHAQRNHDFEWCKGGAHIICNPKGNINTALDDDNCPVKLKRIIKAYGNTAPGDDFALSLPYLSKVSEIGDNTKANLNLTRVSTCPRVIHQGQIIYLSPKPTPETDPYTLYFEAVKWLPRLCKDTDTNFLFDYAFDFLMYRSIVELNFFLKEDERYSITERMLEGAWQSVIAWDSSLISPTETEINL